MTFVKAINQNKNSSSKTPFYKKRSWKIVFAVLAIILVIVISFAAYMLATGSKIFERGLGGTNGVMQMLSGKNQPIKGESEDRVNILLMGMGGANHPGGLLTDSLMMLSFKPSTNQLALVSIPRDLQVKIPNHGDDKINAAFADGYNDYRNSKCNKKNETACRGDALVAGANKTSEVVSSVFNQPIHYYLTLDFSAFEKVIDQLGGIDLNVDKAINDPMFPADDMVHYQPLKIKAGQQHMDGTLSLKYARSRETSSDFDRAARQQKIIGAVKDKALTMGILTNPKKMIDLIGTLGDSMKTSFTPSELKSFVALVKNIDTNNLISKVLSSAPDGMLVDYNNGTYYLKPKSGNFSEIQRFVANIFEPNSVPENPRVEILNGAKTSGLGLSAAKEIGQIGDFQIIFIGTSKEKKADTVIYDYSGGKKKNSLALLQKRFGASIIAKTGEKTNVDFSVIIGDNYKESS